jgi:stalled ribosome rescue protein Dom34
MDQHAAVWMDGQEARVFTLARVGSTNRPCIRQRIAFHRHPKDQLTRTHNHPDDEHRFFRAVRDTSKQAAQILILGPAMTKLLFLRYAQERDPVLEARIVGLETAEHPTDRQIAAHVARYFESMAAGSSRRAPP